MRNITITLVLLLIVAVAFPQSRDYRVHKRGMLHETIFNTGEIGRGFDKGTGAVLEGFPSMEWPPRSRMILDRTVYPGHHNSFGGGLWIAGTKRGVREFMFCGAVSDANGNPTPVEGVYSNPLSIERRENYPVLENGNLNAAFNPNDAEEIIIARWNTPLGVSVTQTSRAWSYPGYDSFIIFEYELHNTTADTLADTFVAFANGFGPSMFGYQRTYNRWGEGDYRSKDQFARFDLKRYMTYNHDRIGRPDTIYFNEWSKPGDRGGLNSPQAAGLVMLYYDYDNLALKGRTQQLLTGSDTLVCWDENNRLKQPFLLRYENGNLPPAKTQLWLDPREPRKTSAFRSRNDSLFFGGFTSPAGSPFYWIGRTKGSTTLSWSQPVVRAYGFAPYTMPPGGRMRFAVAAVVGYGPGVASDSVYQDLGGGIRNEPEPGLHPVPSLYKAMTYPFVGDPPVIGSDYLSNHPLPWYVTPGVVSIRDVADRAIQMYTGRPLVKHDTLQYEPKNSRPNGLGAYNTIPVPVPAPGIRVENTRAAVNRISWGPQVESFNSTHAGGRLRAGLHHYEAMRAPHPLGPWKRIDSVAIGDPRYFEAGEYVVFDTASTIGDFVYYAVVSVDSVGGKSGMTNFTQHETQAPSAQSLGKVYVVPNPLVVTNGLRGSDPFGEVTDRVQFMGLPKRCTIRIFSYSGQLVNTIEHDRDTYGTPYYQISRNNQILASGVYYFVVEDEQGSRAKGKFVIIH